MEKLRRALENTNQQQAQKDQETQANFESWEQKFNSLYENLKAVETRLLNALPLIQQDMGKVQSRLGKQAESLKNQRMMLNGINKKSDEDFKHLKQKQYNMHVRIEEMNGIVGSVLKLMEDQRSFKKYGR